jgi:hypothetical protein
MDINVSLVWVVGGITFFIFTLVKVRNTLAYSTVVLLPSAKKSFIVQAPGFQ